LASEPLDGILSGTPTAPVASSPITITATDANGCAGSIGYTVTVSPAAPSSPIANNQSFATFDSPGAQVTLTGSDPNSLPLTYTVPVNTANGGELRAADPGWTSASIINGVLSIQWAKANNPGSSAPTLSYIPPDQPGADRFTFTVYDGAAYSAPATDSIAIVASGQPLVTSLSPQSGLGGVTALLSGAGLGQAVSAVAYAANPNGSAADFAGPAVFVDLAVSPQTALGDGHTVTATFYLPNFSGSPPPDLLYFPDGSTQWAYVLDQSGRKIPPVADSSINGYSYAVTFNDATPAAPGGMGTTPTVSQLNGTVFAMATPAVPSTATQLQVQAIPTTAFSGTTPVLVTVSALDASGNPATSSDSVTISSSDPIALFKANSLSQPFPLPQTVTLQNGTATFYVTFETVGQPTVTATDARLANPTAVSSAVTVTCPTITLNPTTGTLAGTVNIPYSLTITATGSGVPSTYTVTSGALPSGVSLNATTAVLSGTPSTPGNSTFTVTATDANGCTGNMSYTLAISPAPTSAYVGNDLSASYGGPDGDPPLVILGEYAPDSLGGPQANSSFNLPAGRISDLKFLTTAGENYNFTFYVLKPTGSPGQGEQTFEIVSSTPVAGAAQSAGLQTVTMTPSLPVSAGEVLAFLGVGPDYNSSDALGSDATYEDASEGPETFTATAPNGTSFTVGEHGDSATRYDYISDVFGNQGRTYAIGVDVSLPSSSAQQLLVVAPGQMFSPGTGITGQPRPQIPGRAVPVTVYAVDGQMNLVSTAIPVALQSTTEPTGSFQLSQTSTIESLPQAVTLSAGVATVYVTFHATGGQTVTASDPANNLTPGTTASISVVLPPVAINQTITIPENAVSVPLTLAGSDPNTPPFQIISYAVVPGSGPTQGVLGGTAPALTYTPQQNYVGADSFQFTVNNSYFDSLPATVSINVVQTGLPLTAQATGPAGQTITLIVPQVSDQAGLTASLVNTGPTAPTVAATAYLSNPEPGFTIGGPGTTFLDLSVFDPTDPSGARLAGDSMVAQFSYPAGLSTPPVLKYFTGSAWAVVLSSGSLPPTVDPAQHLMTVVFDNLSTPPVTSLNGTAFALVTPPVCEPPPLGVMNWWPGDGSPNSLNDIVGGNNATSVGDPVTYTTGIAGDGQAWSFDGNGFLATATEVNNPQSFTLECWFSTTTQQGGALLGFCDSQSGQPGNYDRFIYMDDNGYLHFGVYNNNLYTADSALAYNDGNWHHVAATISASGGANLYVDGALVANNPNASVAQNYSGYWRIGEDDLDGWPSQPSNADFNGAIAQVSIYSRPLSSVEIQALYNAGSAAKCESALASGLLTLGSTSRSEGPAIGSDSVVVGAAYPTTTWMAMSDSPAWLTAPSSGTGSGNAIFHYGPNPGAARTGNIVFTRGDGAQTLTLTVVQAGSTYTYETFTAPAQPLIPLASSGLNTPSGVGVDDGGNVYIADTANNVIEEWRYPGGSAVLTLPTQLASGGSLLNPSGVALDGQGNVYVADTGNNAIEQWTPGSPTLTTLVSSAQLPQLGALAGVAVDGGGNVYFCDPQNSVVYQWLPYGQIIALPTQLASGGSLVNPQGVAVDAGGNVYVADTGNGAIEQWTPGSTTLTTLVAPPSSGGILRTPSGVAVDAGGNVYIADSGANMIYEYTAATGNLTPLVSSGLNAPAGVALDGADDLYIADTANQAVEELPYGFVDPTPVVESAFAISGSFSGVLPATANLSLSGPFAPRFTATGGSAQSWLTLMPAGGGEVNFNLTPSATTQTGFLTLLGATIQVTQAALPAGYNSLTATATATAINLVFVGTPGATYVVQSAPALTGPWTALSGNLTADANGNLLFSDAIQPQLPARFYRTQCISGL
jgi:sugar lactone lactonase YvrE